jgi:hypothetical protein
VSPDLAQTLWGIVGVSVQAGLFLWCFGARGKSLLETVARVSIPSIVAAVAAAAIFRVETWGEWAGPTLIGFGGAGAIGVLTGWMRLVIPSSDPDRHGH